MLKSIVFIITALALAAGSAWADGIDGRLGMTIKAGVMVPLTDRVIDTTSDARSALAYGGGLIYGLGKDWAAEVDVTHAPSLDIEQSGLKVGEASLTDISLGVQYRLPGHRVVPYIGAGVDVVKGEFTNTTTREKFDLSWTYGGHVNAGIDFFITRGVAFTAGVRGLYAAKGDMGSTRLDYDPTSFVGTIGFRLFLPEHPTL